MLVVKIKANYEDKHGGEKTWKTTAIKISQNKRPIKKFFL